MKMETNGMRKGSEMVSPEDVDIIVSLSITSRKILDLLGWHYNEDRIYTVKSGYCLDTHLPFTSMLNPIFRNVYIKWCLKVTCLLKSNIFFGKRVHEPWSREIMYLEDISQEKADVRDVAQLMKHIIIFL